MNKTFIEVKDFVKRECKVILAGIAFTLFGASATEADSCQPVFESIPDVEVPQEYVSPVQNGEVVVTLSSNALTTAEKLENAFEKFSQQSEMEVATLREPFNEIAEGLSKIDAEKVVVDGVPSEGRLSVAFRLPDGMILSLNKKLGLHDPGEVGFNLIHNREMVISDVMEVSLLTQYIQNVQKRLG